MHIMSTGPLMAHTGQYRRPPTMFHVQPNQVMKQVAEDLGHTVEIREPIDLGASIPPEVDLIIANMMAPSLPSTGKYGLRFLWTLYQAHHQGVPLIVYHSDWNVFQIDSAFHSIGKSPDSFFLRKWSSGQGFYADDPAEIIKYVDEFREVGVGYTTPGSEYLDTSTILVNKFTNIGDVKILAANLRCQPEHPLVFDFTPYVRHHADDAEPPLPFKNRADRWLLPGLHMHESWAKRLKTEWEVDYLGQRRGNLARVYETEVCSMMGTYKGTLSPEYKHAGSGWHRMRILYAAVNETFIWPGETDYKMLSPDVPIVTPTEFEMMSPLEQQILARYQSQNIMGNIITAPVVTQNQLAAAIDDAIARSS